MREGYFPSDTRRWVSATPPPTYPPLGGATKGGVRLPPPHLRATRARQPTLDGESALLDENLLVEAFAHLGERAPKDAAEIAELSVWALKKALHVAEIDTALMEDITFAIISGLLMKLRGA